MVTLKLCADMPLCSKLYHPILYGMLVLSQKAALLVVILDNFTTTLILLLAYVFKKAAYLMKDTVLTSSLSTVYRNVIVSLLR